MPPGDKIPFLRLPDPLVYFKACILFIQLRLVKQFMGEKAQADQITRCAFSIIGQCFYYGLAWPIVTRIHPMDLSHPATIETLCEHITQFSLGALVHLNDLEQARNTAKKA